jgi:hypothetical protein
MAHTGVLWGGCVVLAALAQAGRLLRRLQAALVVIVLLSFVGASERVFVDQWQLNLRDIQLANRIVARLERHPGFAEVRRVVVIPGRAWYPTGPAPTQWGDMNVSAFTAFWSQVEVLRETSGYNIHRSTIPAELAVADAHCASVAPWPERQAVKVTGELAVVCLAW